jgi:hypothetical protein
MVHTAPQSDRQQAARLGRNPSLQLLIPEYFARNSFFDNTL